VVEDPLMEPETSSVALLFVVDTGFLPYKGNP
jgi:hypothetical protein